MNAPPSDTMCKRNFWGETDGGNRVVDLVTKLRKLQDHKCLICCETLGKHCVAVVDHCHNCCCQECWNNHFFTRLTIFQLHMIVCSDCDSDVGHVDTTAEKHRMPAQMKLTEIPHKEGTHLATCVWHGKFDDCKKQIDELTNSHTVVSNTFESNVKIPT